LPRIAGKNVTGGLCDIAAVFQAVGDNGGGTVIEAMAAADIDAVANECALRAGKRAPYV
jgi:hypothetical protein